MTNLKWFLSSIILFGTFNFASGQTNAEKFKKFSKINDSAKINTLLVDWEKSDPNDPELYTSGMNYYFKKSKQENISLNRTPSGKSSL
jgi:hypothetical protein